MVEGSAFTSMFKASLTPQENEQLKAWRSARRELSSRDPPLWSFLWPSREYDKWENRLTKICNAIEASASPALKLRIAFVKAFYEKKDKEEWARRQAKSAFGTNWSTAH